MGREPQVSQAAIAVAVAGCGDRSEDALSIVIHFEIEIAVSAQHHQVHTLLLKLRALVEIEEGLMVPLARKGRERAIGENGHL